MMLYLTKHVQAPFLRPVSFNIFYICLLLRLKDCGMTSFKWLGR